MNLRELSCKYLAIRRSLGFKYHAHEATLRSALKFFEEAGATFITHELAMHWIENFSPIENASKSNRLTVLRQFAGYCKLYDKRTQIPQQTFRNKHRRPTPYIYSDRETCQLLTACLQLKPNGRALTLRSQTYYTILGLIAVTGCRVSEILSLNRDEVDLDSGMLMINNGKYNKDRLIPLHPTTVEVLKKYRTIRDEFHFPELSKSFFVSDLCQRISYGSLRWSFLVISRQIGLRGADDKFGPRIHDLRHSFAVQTIIDWHKAEENIDAKIPILSTYLGHRNPTDTFWYLSGVPELMDLATNKLEKSLGDKA